MRRWPAFAGILARPGALLAVPGAVLLAGLGALPCAAAPLLAAGGPVAGPLVAAAPWVGVGTAVTAGPGRALAVPQLWRWPLLPKPRVLRAFDAPAKPWLPGHRGVDLAAVVGQPVLSPGTGVVVFASVLAGRGVLSIEYGGIRSSFEPVVPLVKPGDVVVVGEPVALLAPAPLHCRTRPCLHWGAFQSLSVPRHYLDPRLLVGAGPVRLLPDGGGRLAVAGLGRPLSGPGELPPGRAGQLPPYLSPHYLPPHYLSPPRLSPGPWLARGPVIGSGPGSGPSALNRQLPSQVPAGPEPTAPASPDTDQRGVTTAAGIALAGGLVAGGGLYTTQAYRRVGRLTARRGRGHHGPGRRGRGR